MLYRSMRTKKCYICQQNKEVQFFYADRSRLDGYQRKCKECFKALKKKKALEYRGYQLKHIQKTDPDREARIAKRKRDRERKAYEKACLKTLDAMFKAEHKLCRTCNQWLDRKEMFQSDKNNSDGLSRRCRICRTEYDVNRRGKSKGMKETFKPKDYWQVYERFKFKCFNCGAKDNLTVDHNDHTKKLSHKNAAVLCKSCNTKKSQQSYAVFYNSSKTRKLQKILKIN